MLGNKLILFRYLLKQFGFSGFDQLRSRFSDLELKADASDNSLFYVTLSGSPVHIPLPDLKRYDENIINHLAFINRRRNPAINLKYYQYFSLLFTEYFLDRFFSDKQLLLESLNAFQKEFYRESGIRGREATGEYTSDTMNLLAYWNATGSGKTFLLHFNILQYRHYCREINHLILLTPNEQLSRQHLEDLRSSGIEAGYYLANKTGNHVKVIDIYKIREQQGAETISVNEFEQKNGLFVDEGHKGNDKEEGVWRGLREKLGKKGFTFEYSATFGQIGNLDLKNEYSRSIVFDYSYRHFYRDGYGKDYWIHNISDNKSIGTDELRNQYLLHNLLLFTQQKMFFTIHPENAEEFQIENPLMIFVGHTVNPKAASRGEQEDNEQTISDVKLLIRFFPDFVTNKSRYSGYLDQIISRNSVFSQDYRFKFDYLFSKFRTSGEVYQQILKRVFNSDTGGEIELFTLRNAPGEIALKVHNSDFYFGLINIGDVSAFKTGMKDEFRFETDVMNQSLFEALPSLSDKPVNILIGTRKFIEGWNSYRVSSMGLINFGRAEGSQIIQLFGRGVRLKGKNWSLKRTTGDGPPNIRLLETLNIFGLNADYMRRFRDDLEKDGINVKTETIHIPVKKYHKDQKAIDEPDLIILEARSDIPLFRDQSLIKLSLDDEVAIELNFSTKRFIATSYGNQEGSFQTHKISTLSNYLPLINLNRIFLTLLDFKKQRHYYNLIIDKSLLVEILKKARYTILLDHPLQVTTCQDIDKIEKLAVSFLKRYIESFYERRDRMYISGFLESRKLDQENCLLTGTGYEYEIYTTDDQGGALENLEKILQDITLLIESEDYPENLKYNNDGVQLLNNAWFDYHLYQPLLVDKDLQPSVLKTNALIPKGLNAGEMQFVRHLQIHIISEKRKGNYQDTEFYLLRNPGRSKGIGFYFSSAGGFFPDFLFWILKKGKQYLSFIDPHGLRNEDNGFDSDKIQLHKRIKELEKSEYITRVTLNSIILSPSSFKDAGMMRWKDAPNDYMELKTYCNSLNIFEIGQEYKRLGESEYIRYIIEKIVQ